MFHESLHVVCKSESVEDGNMDQFEYKVVAYDTKGFFGGNVEVHQIEDQLNELGNHGWEMVSCTSTTQSYGATKSIVCMFKRKKDQ